jgi:opacity protein-like surface antigen
LKDRALRFDLMEVRMKSFLLTLATLTLVGRAALAADAATPTAAASNANIDCVPGMTAATPGVCSLPGFHWEYTTASLGTKAYDNSYDRSVWMLLPDK